MHASRAALSRSPGRSAVHVSSGMTDQVSSLSPPLASIYSLASSLNRILQHLPVPHDTFLLRCCMTLPDILLTVGLASNFLAVARKLDPLEIHAQHASVACKVPRTSWRCELGAGRWYSACECGLCACVCVFVCICTRTCARVGGSDYGPRRLRCTSCATYNYYYLIAAALCNAV